MLILHADCVTQKYSPDTFVDSPVNHGSLPIPLNTNFWVVVQPNANLNPADPAQPTANLLLKSKHDYWL